MTTTALAAPRALTPPERAKLRAQLKAQLKIVSDDDADDAEELLDYALEMVEGGKAAGHVAEELLFMEMPVCGEAEAAKVGETLAAFFAGLGSDNKDKDDAALQERLARIREKKSERLASVQKGRQAASVRDRIAGLEEGKAKKGGGVSGVPKTKEGEQAPAAGLEKGKGKDDEGVLVGEKKEEERDALPPASSMTVVELKEELRARNDSGYVPHSRLALEAALAAARKKDGTSDTKQVLDPGARLKGGADVDEENGAGEGKGKVAAATSLGSDRGVEGGASVADGRLGAGDIGDVEEGKGSAAVQAASSAGGQGAPAVSAAVHPNMRHHYRAASDAQAGSRVQPSAGSGAHDNDGKGLGVAILVLLLISFGLAFAKPPEPTCRQVGNTFSRYEICTQTAFIAPYIAGACNIIALILTSSLTCHCCCAAGIELEDRAKKFITAALLAIVTMFVLGVVGAFVLSSNGMTITSGITALGVISLVVNVAAIIFVGLFTWSSERCGRNWRDCRSFVRSNRRAVILSAMALAIVVAAAVTAAILVPRSNQIHRDLCYSGVDDPLQIGNGVCQLDYNTEECWFDGGDCLHYNELRASYPRCRIFEPVISWGDGVCDNSLNSEECDYDGGDCREFNAKYPDCQVDRTKLGNGRCDGIGYSEACGWDGNDCEVDGYPNCASEYLLRHGQGLIDIDTTLAFEDMVDQDTKLEGVWIFRPDQVGNGICEGPYNLEACGFDGGDCLEFNERIAEMYPDCHFDSTGVVPCTKECGWSDGNSNNCVPPIGDGSCTGDRACTKDRFDWNLDKYTPKGSIGSSSCNGDGSCNRAHGNIGDNACKGRDSCADTKGNIGANSCRGYYSCYRNTGNIGAGSCNADYACRDNTNDIPPYSCNERCECTDIC